MVSVLGMMTGNISNAEEKHGEAEAQVYGFIRHQSPSIQFRAEAFKRKIDGATELVNINSQGYAAWFSEPHYAEFDPMVGTSGAIVVNVEIADTIPSTFAYAMFEDLALSSGMSYGNATATSAAATMAIVENSMFVQPWQQ